MGTNEFTTKILPLKNNLFRVVFRITGDVEQSEQIVQEALLKVWEDRDSWIVIENLPSYCMMVARNLALRETYSGNKERMGMLSFKPTFSLSSFTFIKKLFSSNHFLP